MSRADELGRLERELGVLIRRVRRVIGERARAVHPDLQPASYLMLSFLAAEGPQRSSVVSEKFNVDKGAISRQVQHLCDLGLLVREPDPADGRAMLISASPDAVRRLDALGRDRRRWLDEQLAEWTEGRPARVRVQPGALQPRARQEHLGRTSSLEPDGRVGGQQARRQRTAGEQDLAGGEAHRPRAAVAQHGQVAAAQLEHRRAAPRRSPRAPRCERCADGPATPPGRTTSVESGSRRCAATVSGAQSSGIGNQGVARPGPKP